MYHKVLLETTWKSISDGAKHLKIDISQSLNYKDVVLLFLSNIEP